MAQQQQQQQKMKLKVLTLITKLSDRDTHTTASKELVTIAQSLDASTLPIFISCVLSVSSNDKSLLKRHALSLLTTLSAHHGNSLSPFLPKILSFVLRRLRDGDSSVRAQCVVAVRALSGNVTKLPLFGSFLKPLMEALSTEQELGAQLGVGLCLAAAIDGWSEVVGSAAVAVEVGKWRSVVGRVERLLKSDAFRAKSSGLVVISSLIGVGGVREYSGVGSLVKMLIGFFGSEDWNTRKSAAEALGKLAVVERDCVGDFKSECLKLFEKRRFDKVKAVRDAMNQSFAMWKFVPDVSDDNASPPPRSAVSSSKDEASDGRYAPGSKYSCAGIFETPRHVKRSVLATKTTPLDSSLATTARKRGPLKSAERKPSPGMSRKADCKKPLDLKIEIAVPTGSSVTRVSDTGLKENSVDSPIEKKFARPEARRALFGANYDENMMKSSTIGGNVAETLPAKHKESEDVSLIRNQLGQIEKQQSDLLDLLQRFMGSSQTGMNSLETRVHGLEMALDEISYDLAVSSGRMTSSSKTSCCLLPAADFLSPKFWRRTEGRYSIERPALSAGTPSLAAGRLRASTSSNAGALNLENHALQLHRGAGFIVNPLAEIHCDRRGISEVAQC